MEELIKSIKAYLYDRTASPLFGAYFMSWSIWNHKIYIILFFGHDENFIEKIKAIDDFYRTFEFAIWIYLIPINGAIYNGFIIPLALTLAYIYFYPKLAEPFYEYSLSNQKNLRQIKQAAENIRLLSVEESREFYRKLAEIQGKYDEEVLFNQNQVSSLNQIIKNLEDKLSSIVSEKNTEDDEDVDDLDMELFDDSIREKIEFLNNGEFQLSDLFLRDQWSSLDNTYKKKIGKRLKQKVDRGDFIGVTATRKGPGNQQIYLKNILDLSGDQNSSSNIHDISQDQEDILKEITFKGGSVNERVFIPSMKFDRVKSKYLLEDLCDKGFLHYEGNFFILSKKGKKFVIDMGYAK